MATAQGEENHIFKILIQTPAIKPFQPYLNESNSPVDDGDDTRYGLSYHSPPLSFFILPIPCAKNVHIRYCTHPKNQQELLKNALQ